VTIDDIRERLAFAEQDTGPSIDPKLVTDVECLLHIAEAAAALDLGVLEDAIFEDLTDPTHERARLQALREALAALEEPDA
jgi:hypothetical protein